jgi:hypothetical protein
MDCRKCSFYKPGNYAQTGTCAKYLAYRGRGKVVYEFAAAVRAEPRKCGPSARFFILKDSEKNVQIERYRLIKSLFEDDE